ncbi:unnamed protein product [Parajaminaea phylloscopi]
MSAYVFPQVPLQLPVTDRLIYVNHVQQRIVQHKVCDRRPDGVGDPPKPTRRKLTRRVSSEPDGLTD